CLKLRRSDICYIAPKRAQKIITRSLLSINIPSLRDCSKKLSTIELITSLSRHRTKFIHPESCPTSLRLRAALRDSIPRPVETRSSIHKAGTHRSPHVSCDLSDLSE